MTVCKYLLFFSFGAQYLSLCLGNYCVLGWGQSASDRKDQPVPSQSCNFSALLSALILRTAKVNTAATAASFEISLLQIQKELWLCWVGAVRAVAAAHLAVGSWTSCLCTSCSKLNFISKQSKLIFFESTIAKLASQRIVIFVGSLWHFAQSCPNIHLLCWWSSTPLEACFPALLGLFCLSYTDQSGLPRMRLMKGQK